MSHQMMFECDRCKAQVSEEIATGDSSGWCKSWIEPARATARATREPVTTGGHYSDLCRSCASDVKRFISTPPSKRERAVRLTDG